MAEQALSKRAVETLDNCLISVNLSAAASNVSLVFVHFFRDAAHELASRINLKHLKTKSKDHACKSSGKPSRLC